MIYHIFSWGCGLLMGILVGSINTINGIWVISGSEQQRVIQMCWVDSANVESRQLNYRSWIFLYIPIMIVYGYALYVLYCARMILRKGIPITFLHRAKVLYTAQVTLSIFLLYYIILALMSFLGSSVNVASNGGGKYIWICVIFLICAKAYPALIVFLIAQNCEFLIENSKEYQDRVQSGLNSIRLRSKNSQEKHNLKRKGDDNPDTNSLSLHDLNEALQLEVVTYSTLGIQKCSLMPSKMLRNSFQVNHSTCTSTSKIPTSIDSHHLPLSNTSQYFLSSLNNQRTRSGSGTPSILSEQTVTDDAWEYLHEQHVIKISTPRNELRLPIVKFLQLATKSTNDITKEIKGSALLQMSSLKSSLTTTERTIITPPTSLPPPSTPTPRTPQRSMASTTLEIDDTNLFKWIFSPFTNTPTTSPTSPSDQDHRVRASSSLNSEQKNDDYSLELDIQSISVDNRFSESKPHRRRSSRIPILLDTRFFGKFHLLELPSCNIPLIARWFRRISEWIK